VDRTQPHELLEVVLVPGEGEDEGWGKGEGEGEG
jgi:hypothetical protein